MTDKRRNVVSPRIMFRNKNPQGCSYHLMRGGKSTLARKLVEVGDDRYARGYDLEREIIGVVLVEKNSTAWTGSLKFFEYVIGHLQKDHIDEVFFFPGRLTDSEVRKIVEKMSTDKVSKAVNV